MRREFEQMYLQWELEIALYDRVDGKVSQTCGLDCIG